MKETQNNWDLTSWSFNDHENDHADLINDLKAAGTIVTKKTIGNTLRCERLKSCSARTESTCRGPSEVCQWFRGELGESFVFRWGQNPALWHQLNSPCLEEEKFCLWPQEHHPHRQTWRWKHYALGVFFCWGDRTTAPHQKDDVRGHVPSGRWSQPGHWKWVMDGYSSMTMSQGNKGEAQKEAH